MAWAPDYATVPELATYRRISDGVDDLELALAITAASRAIDEATGRQFGATATVETRTYEAEYSDRLGLYVVEVDDVHTLTGFVVTVSGTAVTDYRLYPLNAGAKGRPFERLALKAVTPDPLGCGLGSVAVAATFGWSAVPAPIKQACLLQASRFLADRNAPFGVAGSPDLGNEMRLLAKVHADVEVMLTAFTRVRGDVG